MVLTAQQRAGYRAIDTLKETGGHNKKTQALKYKVSAGYSKKFLHKNKPTCFCCGENSHLDFLTIDHIKGKKEMLKDKTLRKLGYSQTRTGRSLNNWLIATDFPRGFQILCWNCNVTKFLYQRCPHKRGPKWWTKEGRTITANKAAKKRKHNLAAKKAADTRKRNARRKRN